ncbi:MAG: hypothetical protein AABZ00_19005 [Chloroflexota bacterium]
MVEQFTHLIIVLNAILLVVLITGIRWWQRKHGKVTEKALALILTGYFSFSSIITSLPLIKINFQVAVVVNLIFLLVFWGIGYPWIRWLYRQFNSSKQ